MLDRTAQLSLVKFLNPINLAEITVEFEKDKRHVKPVYSDSSLNLSLFASFQLIEASIGSISSVEETPDG